MRMRWPTDDELRRLQEEEYNRAEKYDDIAEPICQCGEPGWCCRCEEMAMAIGYWPDGTEY